MQTVECDHDFYILHTRIDLKKIKDEATDITGDLNFMEETLKTVNANSFYVPTTQNPGSDPRANFFYAAKKLDSWTKSRLQVKVMIIHKVERLKLMQHYSVKTQTV